MFVPIKADQYWGYSNSIDDSFIHSKAWMYGDYTHPYYCETNKKWVLVWQPIPYEEAIQASREYYHILPMALVDMSYPHVRAMRIDSYSTIESAMARANKRPPIRLWEPTAIDPHVLECLVERADLYHESNFPVWEKYPEVAKDGCHVTAHKVLLAKKGLNRHMRNPFFEQEMTALSASFAMIHSLRSKKFRQSDPYGKSLSSSSNLCHTEYLRQQVGALEQYTQSPNRTPQFPSFHFDLPVLLSKGRGAGLITSTKFIGLI